MLCNSSSIMGLFLSSHQPLSGHKQGNSRRKKQQDVILLLLCSVFSPFSRSQLCSKLLQQVCNQPRLVFSQLLHPWYVVKSSVYSMSAEPSKCRCPPTANCGHFHPFTMVTITVSQTQHSRPWWKLCFYFPLSLIKPCVCLSHNRSPRTPECNVSTTQFSC